MQVFPSTGATGGRGGISKSGTMHTKKTQNKNNEEERRRQVFETRSTVADAAETRRGFLLAPVAVEPEQNCDARQADVSRTDRPVPVFFFF